MIVDDDASVRFVVEAVLKSVDIDVLLIDSGQACLDQLRNGYRGIILMDVMMPEMDGWDTIRAIVDEGLVEGTRICMLTAAGNPDPEMTPLKPYIHDFLSKPFHADNFISVIEKHLALLDE